jgi:hypothetical protein
MKKAGEIIFVIITLFWGFNINLNAQNHLTGTVNYNSDNTLPIPEVTVGLYNLQDELVVSTVTDDNGIYYFNDIPGGEYYLRSTTSLEPNLVDMQDAFVVLKHLSSEYELNDIQYEAADIDNDGIVSWDDYYYMVNDYLLNGEPFPSGVWQFEEIYIDYTSRDEPPDTSDLWGITEGDVEGVWEPSGRDMNIPDYSYYPVQMKSHEFQIDINTNYHSQIAGFNINLAYPASQLNIIDVTGPDGNLNYVVDENNGFVKIIWLDENNSGRISGDKLITLTVETKTENAENITFDILNGSMLIDANGKEIKDIEIRLPMLEKNQDIEQSISVYPNPFIDVLNIGINLNEAGLATLSIFDVSGRLVSESNTISLEKGEQSITIDTQNLTSGYYIYMVDVMGSTNYRTTGQIVKSR